MEPHRRELLAQCQQSLAQAMTEVETVLGLLEAAGALSPGERRQLDEEAGGAKAELLLQLLLSKEQDHFQDLCAALEKTQPHLLPILYLNGVVGPPQSSKGAGEWQSRGPSCPPATPSLCSSHGARGGCDEGSGLGYCSTCMARVTPSFLEYLGKGTDTWTRIHTSCLCSAGL